MAKKTKWFSGDVKPTIVGVYERRWSSGTTAYWPWGGKEWNWGGHGTPSECPPNKDTAFQQDLKWRGLASDPNGGA